MLSKTKKETKVKKEVLSKHLSIIKKIMDLLEKKSLFGFQNESKELEKALKCDFFLENKNESLPF